MLRHGFSTTVRNLCGALILGAVLGSCALPNWNAGATDAGNTSAPDIAASTITVHTANGDRAVQVIGLRPFAVPRTPLKLTAMTGADTPQPGVNAPPVVIRTIRVGLLVPLTGRNATIGRALQDAATIALYDKYSTIPLEQNGIRVELLPKDTGDAPEQAVEAMQQAVADGAQLIIGPLFADATEAITPLARAKDIPVLSFSNNLRAPGQGIYAFGFSPQDQTRRVLEYAIRQGKTRAAALVPNSALGSSVLAAAKEVLEQHQLALVAQATYAPQGLGVDAAVNQLLPVGGAPGFDILILPEGDAALGTILRTLAAHGVTPKNVQFLGTGMWDDAALVKRVPLDGAWLASSPPQDTSMFDIRFRKTFNYAPPRIASLSYDAVSLVVTLATSGRPFDATTLTMPSGYTGPANGMFRLLGNGKTQRGLAVLQVDNGLFTVISPSPSAFVGTP